jgi:predicted nucleic acid-binding protein
VTAETQVCIDTSVWVKFITGEEPTSLLDGLTKAVMEALASSEIVGPAFLWAEVGSVLRKKVRQEGLTRDTAQTMWELFCALPIRYVDSADTRARAWQLAEAFGLSTLYDAAFLACCEPTGDRLSTEFWTVDSRLLQSLGDGRPPYVRDLSN